MQKEWPVVADVDNNSWICSTTWSVISAFRNSITQNPIRVRDLKLRSSLSNCIQQSNNMCSIGWMCMWWSISCRGLELEGRRGSNQRTNVRANGLKYMSSHDWINLHATNSDTQADEGEIQWHIFYETCVRARSSPARWPIQLRMYDTLSDDQLISIPKWNSSILEFQ